MSEVNAVAGTSTRGRSQPTTIGASTMSLTSIDTRDRTPIFDFNASNISVHFLEGSETPMIRSLRTPTHCRNRRIDMRAIPVIHAHATIESDERGSSAAWPPRSRICPDIFTVDDASSAVFVTATSV